MRKKKVKCIASWYFIELQKSHRKAFSGRIENEKGAIKAGSN